ncbi:gamma-glutamyl-gamma-aminobutyrate hydrolase family protein [Mycolicibacterium sp. CBMA 226]|uniref:gamma-glutamyl-gamma-aminobutyrate hydrolase family protein n=1 Tax=Mycolicibacterium sp. CBMA 226 TaxID=2606611 RepID=UPI0012DBDFAC|nr:gamma-glutamyl-gamma-aminobutyrate hydrolase family protein [Mycolicibacterium sp. CBMA 226]
MAAPAVVVPKRFSVGDDPRVIAANELFDRIVELVAEAGLTPLVVDDPFVALSGTSGLVLPGGGDINPQRYGQVATAAVYDVNDAQDELDFILAARAQDAGLPVLGICRGAQVLNALRGGDLHIDLVPSDVPHRSTTADELFGWHPVALAAGSRVHAAHHAERIVVASAHHQGIASLGTGLVVTGQAADGLIECFEAVDGWVLAVQWHPEAPGTTEAVQRAPFDALAQAIGIDDRLARR